VATRLENLEKSGNSKVVREKSGKLKFALDLFIIDTVVAFSKLVTMLLVINVKQRLFKRYAVYR